MSEVDKLKKLESYLRGPSAIMRLIERVEGAETRLVKARELVTSLFPRLAHGDPSHQAWLNNEINEHFAELRDEKP